MHALCTLAFASPIALGCAAPSKDGSGEAADPRAEVAPPSKLPLLVSVAGGEIQSGFARGTLRQRQSLPAFEITKHPITWRELERCEKAGACEPADSSACGESAYAPYAGYTTPDYAQREGRAPATCVGQAQAEAYCHWIGGRLPSLDEWLLAARGEHPQRFAWGEQATACDQHPLAPQLIEHDRQRPGAMPADPGAEPCEQQDLSGAEVTIGAHAAGASPSGLEDVLLVPAELLAGDPDGMFNACGERGEHCVVYGLEPAAIDSVEPFFEAAPEAEQEAKSAAERAQGELTIAHAYGFRCVLEQKSEAKP